MSSEEAVRVSPYGGNTGRGAKGLWTLGGVLVSNMRSLVGTSLAAETSAT